MNELKKCFSSSQQQGCQMAYLQTKNPSLGKFWRALEREMCVYFWPFGIVYIRTLDILYGSLVLLVVIWYVFSRFGVLHQAKSGNPARSTSARDSLTYRSRAINESCPSTADDFFHKIILKQSCLQLVCNRGHGRGT
jgi:hypothetical protein